MTIDYTCNKIGKDIGSLKKIRKRISKSTAINTYNTTIKPNSNTVPLYCTHAVKQVN